MNRLVIFFIVLLSLNACGITRMSQGIQTESHMERDDSVSFARQVEKMVKDALTENLTVLTNQDIKIDKTIYSEPDSSGKQYVKETLSYKIKSSTEENRILAVESSITVEENIDSTSVSASVEDLEMESITDTRMGLPWWQKTLMILGAAALLLLILKIALKFV